MRRPLFERRVPVILTLILAFAATDAQALVDMALTITGEHIYYSEYHPPASTYVDGWVRNNGDEDSGEYDVTFYASKDCTVSDDDYYLGDRLGHESIRASTSRRFDVRVVFPGDIPLGDYYICGVVSGPAESNLDNNTDCYGTVTLSAHPPDLIVLSVEPASDDTLEIIQPGESIDVDIVIRNVGIGRANSYVVEYYASGDSDYYIGSADGDSLEPGEQHSFTTSCELPSDIRMADYYISVVITWSYDSGSGTVEAGSDNFIAVGSPANLAVQSIQVAPLSYAPGEKLVVYGLIENIGQRDSESYSVDYYVSTDTAIRTSDHHLGRAQRSRLPSGEEDSFETTFDVPFSLPAGNYYIGAIITCDEEYDPANNVGHCAETFALVHPPGYVCGQAGYKNRWHSYDVFPIRYARVKIFEHDDNEDQLDDRLIMQTHTDPNGNYAVILANDPSGNPDIYVKIFTEGVSGAYPETTSRICVLKDEVLDETYSLVSDVHSHPGNASVVINMTSEGNGEFMVFDSVVEGFVKARTFFGVELPEVSTYWPCEGNSSYFDPCEVGVYISQDDRGDRDVIMHEYGHYLAQVYGVAQGEVGDDPRHYWDKDLRYEPSRRTDEEAMNLAFREAWPTLFSVATQYGDRRYPHSGRSVYDDRDELGDWTFQADLDNVGKPEFSPGKYFGNMNAGALWDIFDDKNNGGADKDTLSDRSLSMIWTISHDYKPENIADFWNNWFQKYDFEQEMEYIFETHEMPFVKPE